jgi:hypothetical protein
MRADIDESPSRWAELRYQMRRQLIVCDHSELFQREKSFP